MALMQPAPEIRNYEDVPWFRKYWFVLTMLLLFIPGMVLIAATGDYYQKPNGKMRKQSNARVWRSTDSGRATLVVTGLVLLVFYANAWS